jgi:hypothetical protein
MPPENRDRAGRASTSPGRRGAPLADQPWWAAVLLTVADVVDRPWIALAVWVVVIGRSVPRALDRGSPRPGAVGTPRLRHRRRRARAAPASDFRPPVPATRNPGVRP